MILFVHSTIYICLILFLWLIASCVSEFSDFNPSGTDSDGTGLTSGMEIPEKEISTEIVGNPVSEWLKAMYDTYMPAWEQLFSGMAYPAKEEERRLLIFLCMEIASKTMDLLMVENNDVNLLKRHLISVENVIHHGDSSDSLQDFVHDPTTVPCAVVAWYDYLIENGPKNFKTSFRGYRMQESHESSDEHLS